MKKNIALLIIVALLTLAFPAQVYACDCDCCKNKTTQTSTTSKKALKAKADKELKALAAAGKKYGWKLQSKKVAKNTSSKYYVKVRFYNESRRTYSDLILHSDTKNGKAVTSWWFKQIGNGKMRNTTRKLIIEMFQRCATK